MAACPSCHAEVDPHAELCLGCGEPIGAGPTAQVAREEPVSAQEEPPRVRAPGPPMRPTLPATGKAIRARPVEPEPVRCPGCGVPSRAVRCPGCGAVLRHED